MFSLPGMPPTFYLSGLVLGDVHKFNFCACLDCPLEHCFEKDSGVIFGLSGKQCDRQSVMSAISVGKGEGCMLAIRIGYIICENQCKMKM